MVIGALVATLTELYEPFGINDNVWKLRSLDGGPTEALRRPYVNPSRLTMIDEKVAGGSSSAYMAPWRLEWQS